MLIKQALNILLTEDPQLAAATGGRIYPAFLPQSGPLPAIAWRGGKRSSEYVLGQGQPAAKKIEEEFTFVCVAGSDADAEDVDDLLFNLLDGYAGVISDDASPADILEILGIFIIPEKREEFYVDPLKTHNVRSAWRVVFVRHQR